MLIATTRWIHFCRLCPWGKSHQEYGPVRDEGDSANNVPTSTCLRSLGRIACQFLHVGISPYGGGIPTSGELALRPYCPILRFVDRLRPLRRSITGRMRSK